MNLGSRWNVIYNKLRNYRYDYWLIIDDSVTRLLSFDARDQDIHPFGLVFRQFDTL